MQINSKRVSRTWRKKCEQYSSALRGPLIAKILHKTKKVLQDFIRGDSLLNSTADFKLPTTEAYETVVSIVVTFSRGIETMRNHVIFQMNTDMLMGVTRINN